MRGRLQTLRRSHDRPPPAIWYLPSAGLALAKALELRRLLEAVARHPDHGPGSSVDFATQTLDDVIGYLTPDDAG